MLSFAYLIQRPVKFPGHSACTCYV